MYFRLSYSYQLSVHPSLLTRLLHTHTHTLTYLCIYELCCTLCKLCVAEVGRRNVWMNEWMNDIKHLQLNSSHNNNNNILPFIHSYYHNTYSFRPTTTTTTTTSDWINVEKKKFTEAILYEIYFNMKIYRDFRQHWRHLPTPTKCNLWLFTVNMVAQNNILHSTVS